MAATIVDKLTAEGPGEAAGFLNNLVAQLWPNINVAISKIVKDIADPMFKTMLPGPLASLHFVKVDFGPVPIVLSKVLVTKTDGDGIKLDLNVDWDGQSDIELAGNMIPKLGVKGVALHGRLSILLCPLTNVIPLIGAAQIAFINPPVLKLNFTGAADVADVGMINDAVLKVILSIMNGMLVLPNRLLVKLDITNDYFKTYLHPLGIVRLTVGKAWGFAEEAKSTATKLFSKLTRASPDCYVKVDVGAEEMWKTTVKPNTTSPAWEETHDFILSDFNQCIKLEIMDQDVGFDKHVGLAVTTVEEIITAGGQIDLPMLAKGVETTGKISLNCQFLEFTAETASFTASENKAAGRLCGLLTILIAGASNLPGARHELSPSVVVTWGTKHHFQTAIKVDAPGMDISNPSFDQNFRVLVNSDHMVGTSAEDLRITVMNKKAEIGKVDVPFKKLMEAPGMKLEEEFEVGGGAKVRASFWLRGVREASVGKKEMELPKREK